MKSKPNLTFIKNFYSIYLLIFYACVNFCKKYVSFEQLFCFTSLTLSVNKLNRKGDSMSLNVSAVSVKQNFNNKNLSNNGLNTVSLKNNLSDSYVSSKKAQSFGNIYGSQIGILNRLIKYFKKNNVVYILPEQKEARAAHNYARVAYRKVSSLISNQKVKEYAVGAWNGEPDSVQTLNSLGVKISRFWQSPKEAVNKLKPLIIKSVLRDKDNYANNIITMKKAGLIENTSEFSKVFDDFVIAREHAEALKKFARKIKDTAYERKPEFAKFQKDYVVAKERIAELKHKLKFLSNNPETREKLNEQLVQAQGDLSIAKAKLKNAFPSFLRELDIARLVCREK